MDTQRLVGKVAVVTGAGSGIGLEVARRFTAEGASVVLVDLAAPTAAADGLGLPERVLAVGADVVDPGQVEAAYAAAVERFGRVDVAVNNAGVMGGGWLHDDGADAYLDRMLDVLVRGVWNCSRSALARMRPQGSGVILNTGSSASQVTTPKAPAYGLAKAAVHHLTRSLAAGYAPDGIRVNEVLPGPTRTAIFARAGVPDEKLDVYARHMPLGLVDPARVAAAFAFLASDDAASITGAALSVDGGLRPIPIDE
jgi:NAD(P)-dependent dehydrogenase (short-subunit alcohol dehydrogenase family)